MWIKFVNENVNKMLNKMLFIIISYYITNTNLDNLDYANNKNLTIVYTFKNSNNIYQLIINL